MPTLSQDLLVGFDGEMSNTHKLLECLPDGAFDYKPHAKSMSLGQLAGHISELPRWAHYALERDSLDVSPPDGIPQIVRFVAATRGEAVERFDGLAEDARRLIGGASDEKLSQPWTFLFKERAVFTNPRAEVLHTWFLHHLIHHRAQLGVFLRLLDIPIPGMYGPSADTQAALRAQLEQ